MEEITADKKKITDKIAQKYSLEMILLFGSQVSGKTSKESDFDIAYLSKKELSGKEEIELNCDLMDVFKSDKIDLTNLKNANPFLNYEIAKKCRLILGDEKKFSEFKIMAFKKYIDHLPLLDFQSFLIKKRHRILKELIYDK